MNRSERDVYYKFIGMLAKPHYANIIDEDWRREKFSGTCAHN